MKLRRKSPKKSVVSMHNDRVKKARKELGTRIGTEQVLPIPPATSARLRHLAQQQKQAEVTARLLADNYGDVLGMFLAANQVTSTDQIVLAPDFSKVTIKWGALEEKGPGASLFRPQDPGGPQAEEIGEDEPMEETEIDG